MEKKIFILIKYYKLEFYIYIYIYIYKGDGYLVITKIFINKYKFYINYSYIINKNKYFYLKLQ